jgi:hypothetical protein
MKIWGREFELGVYFNVFEGEEISKTQKEALDLFLKANASNIINNETQNQKSDDVDKSFLSENSNSMKEKSNDINETQKQNLVVNSEPTPVEKSKEAVERYCIDNSNEEEIDKPIANIFKYVIPKYIYVDNLCGDTRIVALMCNFKFDMEHGLAVVFTNEKFDEVGEQGLVF